VAVRQRHDYVGDAGFAADGSNVGLHELGDFHGFLGVRDWSKIVPRW
jgi:hypothetical protein